MRRFGTQGPVNPEQHYVVPRTEELTEFIKRVKEGRYIVIFAPRQTGKTTFFYAAMDILATEEPTYLPIHLDFEAYKNLTPSDFYSNLTEDIREEIENLYHKRGEVPSEALRDFLENTTLTDNVSMLRGFRTLARLLEDQRVVVFIDEFDGIPPAVVSDFSVCPPPHLYFQNHPPMSAQPRNYWGQEHRATQLRSFCLTLQYP